MNEVNTLFCSYQKQRLLQHLKFSEENLKIINDISKIKKSLTKTKELVKIKESEIGAE